MIRGLYTLLCASLAYLYSRRAQHLVDRSKRAMERARTWRRAASAQSHNIPTRKGEI